jgi:DNA-binding NarL/FixJ family response regulator
MVALNTLPVPDPTSSEQLAFATRIEQVLSNRGLTTKETEIFRLVLKGLSTSSIARISGNTDKTIKHHIASIFQKFGASSRAELFAEVFPT